MQNRAEASGTVAQGPNAQLNPHITSLAEQLWASYSPSLSFQSPSEKMRVRPAFDSATSSQNERGSPGGG